MIEIKKLEKIFNDGKKQRYIFRNISLSIPEGRFVGITGPSGSGKSTLLNILSGLESFERGEVHIGSFSLAESSEKQKTMFRRKNIGFIFQDFQLIDHLRVFENIQIPLELNRIKADKEKIQRILKVLGIQDLTEQFPDRLSGGEKQRVSIARACIHSPKLILADEPTGNLDSKTAHSIFKLLKKISGQIDSTVLMATHDLSSQPYLDNVYSIENKRLKP